MKNIVFTTSMQIDVALISKVKILDTDLYALDDNPSSRFVPRIVINDSEIIEGEEGLSVIDQLLEFGFYTESQHKLVRAKLEQALRTDEMIFVKK